MIGNKLGDPASLLVYHVHTSSGSTTIVDLAGVRHARRSFQSRFMSMTEAPPADGRFEATLSALEQFSRELVAARETIVQQQQEIEQLRLVASTALQAKEEAMAQVARAFHLVKAVRLRAA